MVEKSLRSAFSRMRGLLTQRRAEEELAREIDEHLAMLTDRLVRQGLSEDEARLAARRQFGAATQMKERLREQRGLPWIEELFRDCRYAVRQLRKAFGFTFVAISVLALGVGANTAIFSVINAVLLKPLPYSKADRLVWIGETLKGNSTDQVTLTPDFLEWRDHNHAFTGMAAFNILTRTLTNSGAPLQLHTARVSASLLSVLEVQPVLGRNLARSEDRKGGGPVGLISYKLWKGNLGGDSHVLGRLITLDDRVYTVIGVLPPTFYFPAAVSIDAITALAKNEETEMKRGDGMTIVHDVIGRLKPGVSLAQARSEMETMEARIAPPAFLSGLQMTVKVVSLQSQFAGNLRRSLLTLLCAVGFLLLMACANLSNLLFGRAIARQREMAIRSSLGASRARLFRQLLVESVVLAGFGCLAGLVLAFCTRGILLRLLPQTVPGLESLSLDWRVLSFALLSAGGSAVASGIGPALLSSAAPLAPSLTTDGRFITSRFRRQFWFQALASLQIATAIVLLFGGGLMGRSFWNLRYRNLGFETEHLLSAQVHLRKTKYADVAAQSFFARRLLENLSAVPGVEGVAVGNLPPGEDHATNGFAIEGQAMRPEGQKPVARSHSVSPNYFKLLHIPLLQGRGFAESDRAGTGRVVLVSQTFVRRNFPGDYALGRRLRLGRDDEWSTIIGIAADVKTAGLLSPAESIIYFPYAQAGAMTEDMGVLLRTAFQPESIEPELRRQVARLDTQQPITDVQTMDHRLNESIAKPRLATVLLGCFAALGLLLATVSLYGVMSLLVRGRFRDIGIRLALGAQPGDVSRMVLASSLQIILLGMGVGICGALLLARFMRSLLYEVSPSDPLTLAAMTGFLTSVALAASYLPARRAARVDPVETLRLQ